MPIKNHFTTREATALAGFKTTYMVDYLARTAIVVPSVRAAPGKGSHRLYSFSDVVLLRALNRLLGRGIPVKKLSQAQDTYNRLYRGLTPGQLPARYLMTDGTRIFYTEDPSRIVDLTSKGQLAFGFVVDMEPINKEVVAGIEKLPARRARRSMNLPRSAKTKTAT